MPVSFSPFSPYTLPFSSFYLPSSPHAETDQPSLVWFDRGKFYLTFEGKSGFFTQDVARTRTRVLSLHPHSRPLLPPSVTPPPTATPSLWSASASSLLSSASQRSSTHVTQQPDLSLGIIYFHIWH